MQLAKPAAAALEAHYEAGAALSGEGLAALGALGGAVETMADALERRAELVVDGALVSRLEQLAAASAELKRVRRELEEEDSDLDADADADMGAEGGIEADMNVALGADGTPPPPAAAGSDHVEPAAASYDPEIAAIFAEEAAELLDQAEVALQDLTASAQPELMLQEMQRQLHTLKGGARMAGVVAMGDLSHALETLLAQMATGRVAVDSGASALVQRCLDQLHQMRDAIDAGQPVSGAGVLIAKSTPGRRRGRARRPRRRR